MKKLRKICAAMLIAVLALPSTLPLTVKAITVDTDKVAWLRTLNVDISFEYRRAEDSIVWITRTGDQYVEKVADVIVQGNVDRLEKVYKLVPIDDTIDIDDIVYLEGGAFIPNTYYNILIYLGYEDKLEEDEDNFEVIVEDIKEVVDKFDDVKYEKYAKFIKEKYDSYGTDSTQCYGIDTDKWYPQLRTVVFKHANDVNDINGDLIKESFVDVGTIQSSLPDSDAELFAEILRNYIDTGKRVKINRENHKPEYDVKVVTPTPAPADPDDEGEGTGADPTPTPTPEPAGEVSDYIPHGSGFLYYDGNTIYLEEEYKTQRDAAVNQSGSTFVKDILSSKPGLKFDATYADIDNPNGLADKLNSESKVLGQGTSGIKDMEARMALIYFGTFYYHQEKARSVKDAPQKPHFNENTDKYQDQLNVSFSSISDPVANGKQVEYDDGGSGEWEKRIVSTWTDECVNKIFGSTEASSIVNNVGLLGPCATQGRYKDTKTYTKDQYIMDSDLSLQSKAALLEMIYQYGWYCTKWREGYLGTSPDERKTNGELLKGNQEFQACLKYLHDMQEDFGVDGCFPILQALWRYEDPDDPENDYSLEELYNSEVADPAIQDFDPKDFKDLKSTNALSMFYTLNSINGISSIDRESVLNPSDVANITEDNDPLQANAEVTKLLRDYYGLDDGVGKTRGEAYKWLMEQYQELNAKHDWQGAKELKMIMNELELSEGVKEGGQAYSTDAVTMSEGICRGMSYSASFIPMRTNLYSPNTLKDMDIDNFLENFYYKYGFYRKVLKWDKSATSVMDYYNATDKLTHPLYTITLRDLLENCDKDISIYVDGDVYNTTTMKETGAHLLQAQAEKNADIIALLTTYVNLQDNKEAAKQEDVVDVEDGAGTQATDKVLHFIESIDIPILSPIASGTLSKVKNIFVAKDEAKAIDEAIRHVEDSLRTLYNFDVTNLGDLEGVSERLIELQTDAQFSEGYEITDQLLKTNAYGGYDTAAESQLSKLPDSKYVDTINEGTYENDNYDSIVLPSTQIADFLDGVSTYSKTAEIGDEKVTQNYQTYDSYTPMLSFAFISALYRDADLFSLANTVAVDNPVFLSSKDLCGVKDVDQWYANTVLNYVFVNNLKAAAQIDYNYIMDLDKPLYIDIFGNILTESGTVVIPAACNATLHTSLYYGQNLALGLYSIYGKSYYLPITVEGAAQAMFPFFTVDREAGMYIINGRSVNISGTTVQYNTIQPYNTQQVKAIVKGYYGVIKDVKEDKERTFLNWPAMVSIVNEVLRGAPLENYEECEAIQNVGSYANKAGVVSAMKLETLISSLKGSTSNTLLNIPDFTRMEHMEVFVAFMIKMIYVLTAAVCLLNIYKDAAGGELGLRTLWKTLTAIALTFSAICIVPAVFQVTYYASNKLLLQKEVARILLVNLETQEGGMEVGMTEIKTPEVLDDFSIQLDYIKIPWYDQLEQMLYGSTLSKLDKVKLDAYSQSEVFDHYDVEVYNDGVYTTLGTLFHSVDIDFNDNIKDITPYGKGDKVSLDMTTHGLYLHSNNEVQTAGFYLPYYVFLKSLVSDINAYNYLHNSYNHTTKYMSGNRCKTVGSCEGYFTSKNFMEDNEDILHISDIYNIVLDDYDSMSIYSSTEREQMKESFWYCTYSDEHVRKRINVMNTYARDFVTKNHDMLTKVTDETFIKVMALYLATKYNQLFGIPVANTIDIYNLDSNQLLRLCIAKTEEAAMCTPMSYARYVYNFGGEPGVILASILEMIMWAGSYIKPLCTILVFLSVFASIWIFRVVLRKPSANLWGYLITVLLLCATNILHAFILKLCVYLPDLGLSAVGCLIFIIVGQVGYMVVLAYVTGVALKDWTNLGFADYQRNYLKIKGKLKGQAAADNLNGRLKHHDDNWEYYNDLVEQHRKRNG